MNTPHNQHEGHAHAAYGPEPHGPIPWAEIFSRHEAVLSSHLQLLGSVKENVEPDGEASRTVSSMVNKTVQAMNQFKVVRKYMINKKTPGNAFDSSSCPAARMNPQTAPTSQSTDPQTTSRRKRSRTANEGDTPSTDSEFRYQSNFTDNPPATKRRRDAAPHASENSPAAEETEDISEEVQRRLRIQEERRRRKESVKPEKRKRESLLSNESTSPGMNRPKRKRVRSGEESKKAGNPEADEGTGTKKQKKGRHGTREE